MNKKNITLPNVYVNLINDAINIMPRFLYKLSNFSLNILTYV